MKRYCSLFAFLIFACALACAFSCDPLEEKSSSAVAISAGDDWEYPYHLVIGGGLSETLSVLTIHGADDFSLENDVQTTGSGINQTENYDNRFFALCTLSHSVVVYDPTDLSIVREVSVGLGNNPMGMVFYEDQKAFFSNFLTDSVTYYDLSKEQGEPIAEVPLPTDNDLPKDPGVDRTWPRAGSIARVQDRVFVTLSNLDASFEAGGPGVVAVIDAQNMTLDKTIELHGKDTVGIYADEPNGVLYTVSAGDHTPGDGFVGQGIVEVLDIETETIVGEVALNGAPFEMILADTGVAYLTNGREGKILSFDANTLEELEPIDIRDTDDGLGLSFSSALAIDGHGLLYAAEFNHDRLFIIDTNDNNKIVKTFTVNDGPDTLTLIH